MCDRLSVKEGLVACSVELEAQKNMHKSSVEVGLMIMTVSKRKRNTIVEVKAQTSKCINI